MNKRVLITGAGGFIGSNFAHRLVDLHYNVGIIEKEGTSLWRLEKIKNKIKIHYINLENYQEVENLVVKLHPKIILHFAAYGVYPKKQKDINDTITTNIMGTINLINACSRIAFDCFINTSSNSEYGQKQKPMKETDALEPNNLYGITKAAATMYCSMMAKKFDLPIITVRPFMAYGYFEEKERLIPTIINSCLTNAKLTLPQQPNSVRDFLFIEDFIEAYLKIIKHVKKIKGQVFNLGSGKQHTISEVVKIVKQITHSEIKPEYSKIKNAQLESKIWVADISKTKTYLHWKPKNNLEQGLKKTVAWFEKNIYLYHRPTD